MTRPNALLCGCHSVVQARVRSLEGSYTSEALKPLHQALSSGAYARDRTMDAALGRPATIGMATPCTSRRSYGVGLQIGWAKTV